MEEKQLTIEEVLEKYGNIELYFSSYYKYSFTYTYKKDNLEIIGSYGGNSDDIYRYDVTPNKKVLVKFYKESLQHLTIVEDGKIVFNYSDY